MMFYILLYYCTLFCIDIFCSLEKNTKKHDTYTINVFRDSYILVLLSIDLVSSAPCSSSIYDNM